jgi:hypothetical protein
MEKADANQTRKNIDRMTSHNPRAISRADILFLIAFALLFLSVQILLLSPILQAKIPFTPAVSYRVPSVITSDYTQYKSTFSCLPTPTQSSCAIPVHVMASRSVDFKVEVL